MPSQTVVWIALPNGIGVDASNTPVLRLSLYVSLRLQTDVGQVRQPLRAFGDITNWPDALTQVRPAFSVMARPQQADSPVVNVPFEDVRIVSPPPDRALWAGLFSPDLQVESFAEDQAGAFAGKPISSYSASRLLAQLRQGYQRLGGNPDTASDLPGPAELQRAFPELHAAFLPLAAQAAAGQALSPEQSHAAFSDDFFRPGPTGSAVENAFVVRNLSGDLAAAQPQSFVPVVRATDNPASLFAQLFVFHTRGRPPQGTPGAQGPAAPPPAPPALNFHTALTSLAQYPELLRRLGLVLDLEIPFAKYAGQLLSPLLPTGVAPRLVLQVIPNSPQPHSWTDASPFTAYVLDLDRFFVPASATPGQPETIGGLVNLQLADTSAGQPPTPQFSVLQLDVDGASLKVIGMAAGQSQSTDPAGSPATRTSGAWLARAGQGQLVHASILTAQANTANLGTAAPVILFAEDLLRGYRVDVLDLQPGPPPRWRSLHQRSGSYQLNGAPINPPLAPDEGQAQPSATQHVPAVGPPDPALYIHEALFHWQGWSLAARRPGKTISDSGPTDLGNQPGPDFANFPLDVNFSAVPGSLPRLRFGHQYQFRLRAVDPAGNSLSSTAADELLQFWQTGALKAFPAPPVLPWAPDEFTYRRFEPVLAPVLLHRERPTEGESVERLVIRSTESETAAACAARLMALVASSRPQAAAIYTSAAERHVAAPKASELMVETHGLLDASFGPGGGDPALTYRVAVKEKGTFNDTSIIDVTTGQSVAIPDTTGVAPASQQVITRPAVERVATNPGADPTSGFSVHHEPQLELPYLPDPLARGAALFGVPGVAVGATLTTTLDGSLASSLAALPPRAMQSLGSVTHVAYGPDWPARTPFRLRLAEPDADPVPDLSPPQPPPPPVWDAQARTLTVFLRKAEQVTVRLSSYLASILEQQDPAERQRLDQILDVLGIWRWLLDVDSSSGLQAPDPLTALSGGVWLLSPFRNVTLVHAVQRPLVAPVLNDVVTTRDPGATAAVFGATVSVHGKSTAKLDVLASWQETVDEPSAVGPQQRSSNAHVFDVSLEPSPLPLAANPLPVATYDGQNTVTFWASTPPGWRGGPPHPRGGGGGGPGGTSRNGGGHTANGSTNGTGGGGPVPPTVPSFLSRQEFGDTRHRGVSYQVVATTRFREYFPPELTGDPSNITLAGVSVAVNILSSARPQAPDVVYAVPLFAVSRSVQTNPDGTQSRVSVRGGGGVRVYLRRPWYSSGDGELLGVVLANASNYPPDDTLRPYVTHWGGDPVFATGTLNGPPQLGNFSGRTATGPHLLLDEAPGVPVQVAGHPVAFDADRGLWYSDIRIDQGQPVYRPFIRLALARYQPDSLPDCELSRVVLADFVQLAPDRTVTLTSHLDNPNLFDLRVEGLTYQATDWLRGDEHLDEEDAVVLPPGLPPMPERVRITVERRPAALVGTPGGLGWVVDDTIRPQVNVTVVGNAAPPPGSPLWSGQISLPADRGPGQLRIAVREFEHLPDDTVVSRRVRVTVSGGDTIDGKPRSVVETRTFSLGADRLVFAEDFEL